MLRLLFWLLVIGAAVLVLNGTMPLPGIPQEEIVYETPPPVVGCAASACLAVYTLEMGNVGRSAQESVRVRLRTDAVETPVIAPTMRRGTENVVVESADDRPGIETFALGRVEPEERVTLVFALRAGSRGAVPGWDRVLVGVDASSGAAHPGAVGTLTAGRIVHAAGRFAERVTEAVKKAIAS